MMTQSQQIVYRSIEELIPYARNSRTHSDEQVAQIAASIKEFGFTNPILTDGDNGIIAGHGRLAAARKLGIDSVPTLELSHLSDTQKRAYIIADNKLALNAGWDYEMLAVEIDELNDDGFNLELLGFLDSELEDLIGNPDDGLGEGSEGKEGGAGSLSEKFMIPPFTVMNAREGWWQQRKKGWLSLGIESEIGRAGNLLGMSNTVLEPDPQKRAKIVTGDEYDGGNAFSGAGTSIFDPVLCEIAYRWFSPESGVVLDPFAGGSVRGIVAAKLGRQYIGGELREEQVEANREQADKVMNGADIMPIWVQGDSRNIDKTCSDVEADFIFSCPPYADLEVYSDDPNDLSTLPYDEFRKSYFEIIAKACSLLKPNRFAAFVVGEVRDKKSGAYVDFVGDTVQAFREAGLDYYNEAILVTAVGTLPIRAGRTFSASRKLGKTHQNILVFVKGDGFKASKACGEVEISDECLTIQSEEVEVVEPVYLN
jgi:hypothetical protein